MSRRRVYGDGTAWLHVPLPVSAWATLLRLADGKRASAGRIAGAVLAAELAEVPEPNAAEIVACLKSRNKES